MPWRPRIWAPVGKSGPFTNSMSSSGVASGCSSRCTVASMTSPRLCGGMLVAIPTAMPWEPLTSRLGKRAGQHRRLLGAVGVVRDEVDGLLVDAGHEVEGQRLEPALGVAHGRRALVGPGAAEVAVAVDQRVAQAEVLHHADQGVVDGRVAVGVVGAHDLADHRRALHVRAVGPQVLVEHRVEDPPVHRLEPVAHVGQGPRDDDRHGVLEERALHLLLDLDGLDEAQHRAVVAGGPPPELPLVLVGFLVRRGAIVRVRLRRRGSGRPSRWTG